MLSRHEVESLLRGPAVPPAPNAEVERTVARWIDLEPGWVTILVGTRRCGKSTLLAQFLRRKGTGLSLSLADPRLAGMASDGFVSLLSALDAVARPGEPVFLDDVQATADWPRLVRVLLERGRAVCLTGSSWSVAGRKTESELLGRHRFSEVLPFDYPEYLSFTGAAPSAWSLRLWLGDGGFPDYLVERRRGGGRPRGPPPRDRRHARPGRAEAGGRSRRRARLAVPGPAPGSMRTRSIGMTRPTATTKKGMQMDLAGAERILNVVEGSRAAASFRGQWLEAAVRYAGLRAAWWLAPSPDRLGMDASRTSAHDAFIDECNILSRAMAGAGESNSWRAEIGTERGEIGDFACLLHCVLGLRAR